jgi:hypothetical protein
MVLVVMMQYVASAAAAPEVFTMEDQAADAGNPKSNNSYENYFAVGGRPCQ